MTDVFKKFDRVVDGKKYRVEFIYDQDTRVDDATPHVHNARGIFNDEAENLGRKLIYQDMGSHVYFDHAAAVGEYRKDGNPHEKAVIYAGQDFERIRDWYHDNWFYHGIVVMPYCEHCGEPTNAASNSLWGIESDAGDEYFEEIVSALIDNCQNDERRAA